MVIWICDSMNPYKTVANEPFKVWIESLQPKFDMPSEKLIRTKIIPELYQKMQYFIKGIIGREMLEFAFTTDAWTSSQQESLLSITVHIVTRDLTRKVAILRTMPANYSHTAEALQEDIKNILIAWGLKEPVVILRDNAANISKALEGMNGVPCFIHTLQLVVKHSILKQKQVANIIKKSRNLVKKLRKPAGMLVG